VKVIFFNLIKGKWREVIERKKILICKKKEKQEREMISQSRQKSLRGRERNKHNVSSRRLMKSSKIRVTAFTIKMRL
jgi:hypothetical protein